MENNQRLEMSAGTVVDVKMTAGEWSQVLAAIDEMPRKLADPLYSQINNALLYAANGNQAIREMQPEAKLEEEPQVDAE